MVAFLYLMGGNPGIFLLIYSTFNSSGFRISQVILAFRVNTCFLGQASFGSLVLCFRCRGSVVLWLIWGQSHSFEQCRVCLWLILSQKVLYQIEPCTPEAWRTNLFLPVFSSLFIKIMCTALHQALGNQRKWCMPPVQLLMVFMSGPSLGDAAFPSRNLPKFGCFHPAWSLPSPSPPPAPFLSSCLTSADDKIKAQESNWLLKG